MRRDGIPLASHGLPNLGPSQVDLQGEESVLEGGGGVADHGEVHEVDLCPLDEAFLVRAGDGGEGPALHRLGPFLEALDHCLGIELVSHAKAG